MQAAVIFLGIVACVAALPSAPYSGHGAPHSGHGDPHDGLSFSDVKALLETLESRKNELFARLSHVATLCAVADQDIGNVQNGVTLINKANEGLNGFIDSLQAQTKDLTHRADAATVVNRGWSPRLGNAFKELDTQLSFLQDIETQNDLQDDEINYLRGNATEASELLDTLLTDTLTDVLIPEFEQTAADVGDLQLLIDNRKCEYGFANLDTGVAEVNFQTPFDVIPEVTLQLAGFSAHLDVSHYHDNSYSKPVNVLGLDKYVSNSTETGFTINLLDSSQGEVELKSAFCSWSACQLDPIVDE